MQYDESLLIKRASRGDAKAFNALMEQHERRMYAAAYKMMHNPEDAQDCLQDAMLRVYRAIARFKGESAFSTWVYRITVNTCLDELRKRNSSKNNTSSNVSMDQLMETGWSPRDESDSPEQASMKRETRKHLKAAIDDLPDDMRQAIELRDIQGYSYEEIAEILEINVGTVKSRISRGRGKLRETISRSPELFGLDNV